MMNRTYEGKIEIDLDDFFKFVQQYIPNAKDNVAIGVPVVNKHNKTIEISFAGGDADSDPATWAVCPNAIVEWKELK